MRQTFRIHPLTAEDIQAQEQREKVELFPNYTFVCFRSFDIEPITDQIKPYNYYCLIFKDGFLTVNIQSCLSLFLCLKFYVYMYSFILKSRIISKQYEKDAIN